MSIQEQIEFSELKEELRESCRKNCLAIVYGRKTKSGGLDFRVASAFIYNNQKYGIPTLVTAGHVLDDPEHGLKAWDEKECLEFVSLCIPTSCNNNYEAVNLDSWQHARTWTEQEIDLACMPISAEILKNMWEKGVKPIPTDRLMNAEPSSLPIFVLGFPSVGVRKREERLFSIIEQGVEFNRVFSSVGALSFAAIPAYPPQEKSQHVMESECIKGSPSFRGFSGGYVIELVNENEELRVNWLGVQFSETNVQRSNSEDVISLGDKRPLRIQYVSSIKVCELLDEFLSAFA